jgi:hypothetical protein
MKLYIAGKVTGLPYVEVTQKFGVAQVQLRAAGFKAINPLQVVSDMHERDPKADRLLDTPWEWCMRWCLAELMTCHGMVILPCWADSRGAKLERYVAGCLNIPVYEGLKDPKLKALQAQLQPETTE